MSERSLSTGNVITFSLAAYLAAGAPGDDRNPYTVRGGEEGAAAVQNCENCCSKYMAIYLLIVGLLGF